ncbi:MAG TPA: IS200/IS605 family transposase [Polyangiales bacterium]|nr:IS200/IS605 family transposase [Polyangiales bacterium]
MARASDFRTGRRVIFKLQVHLVFVPKYRKSCITARVAERLHDAFALVCTDFESELLEFGHEPDHVHLLIAYPPKVALSKLVNSLKGVSARRLRTESWPEITRALRGDAFWSPSYCAVSCGGAPLDAVRQYVEKQRGASPPT